MFENLYSLYQTDLLIRSFEVMLVTMPIWLPVVFAVFVFNFWVNFKRREFISNQGTALLEIKIPKEMSKSPKAMEAFLTTLHNTAVGNLMKVYLEGSVRPWHSLEIVSIDGAVHFFIWTWEKNKAHVETQLYAQFPGIEVHEVADYALGVHHDPDKIKFGWFGQFTLTKEDAFPIKTYVDYRLHEDPKEEYKVDPIVPLLEYMGSLRQGEQAWVQILIQAHAKEGLELGRLIPKPDWKKGVETALQKFIKDNAPSQEDKEKTPTVRDLTKEQQEMVAAISRNKEKWAFDTMIRATYFSEIDVFNPANIGGLIGSWKQYSSAELNGFKPQWSAGFKYDFQDLTGRKKAYNERALLEAYKRRSFFNEPFKNFHGKPFILTTEELATIFHFPSAEVAATPTLSRIPSKKSQAPANLPI